MRRSSFLQADDDQMINARVVLQTILYEEDDRSTIFEMLKQMQCDTGDSNSDDDFEDHELFELLQCNDIDSMEQEENEICHKNNSEKHLEYFKSNVTSDRLDENTVLGLSKHLRCNAHKLNLVGSTDILRALRNKQFSKLYQAVFEKLNLLWHCSGVQASSEIIIKCLGRNLTKSSKTRWNDIYEKVIEIFLQMI